MNRILDFLPDQLLPYIHQVPLVWWLYAANFLFLALSIFCLWVVYYSFRRALGHEKFKGNWYTPSTLQKLKQELYSGVRDGRLPDSETMAFLDRHIYGKESELRRLSGNGWL
jgi:hypothetical protein